ncbi:hypothetical protein H310_08046 [Aphanomyces invadans]|uniref:START domain-containing protein n=1 Tax=Aphanomyces invadans TaxID=157072 RepID=A0A024TZA3_9STRA|nr:hypothetical protein H310_08046 [Aphanomyces invadans]ETV99314.1 hypothetical protein H310_08046 [Aphanomyces invadans]RHY31122.1 hypothetical protein DYB32_003740 [Aphanomyces invadans]|eukprot:XP_008871870.1 hypothetical protein H310_08046 [Aphanomyces invadans]
MVRFTASQGADAIAKATKGFDDLVLFSHVYVDQDKKKYSSTAQPTTTSSFAVHHATVVGTVDVLSANDAVLPSHVELTTQLSALTPDNVITVQYSVVKSPVPFVRDRDAIFTQVRRHFVDSKGRPCYAWYRTSLPAEVETTPPIQQCVRATIHSWGSVLVQVTPHTLTHFTVIDIDWSGNVSTWVASRLTSKLVGPLASMSAASGKHPAASPTQVARKHGPRSHRCSMCRTKPLGKCNSCVACGHVVCAACSDLSLTAPRCLACVVGMRKRNASIASSTDTILSSSMVSYEFDGVSPTPVAQTTAAPSCKSTRSHLMGRRHMDKLWTTAKLNPVTDLGYVAEQYPNV